MACIRVTDNKSILGLRVPLYYIIIQLFDFFVVVIKCLVCCCLNQISLLLVFVRLRMENVTNLRWLTSAT